MNKIWVIFVLIILGCSKAQLPLSPELNTTLEINAINPAGEKIDSVQVFWDSKIIGITPYKNENIQIGLHSLRLMKEGYHVFTQQLLFEQNQQYNIEAVLIPMPPNVGELVISVNQDSSLVTVKNSTENTVVQTYERTSSHILPIGSYIVSGEKPGVPKVVKAVEILAGKSTAVNLELIVPDIVPPTLEFSINEDSVQFGDAITLNWQSNGYQVIIDQGIGTRGPNGTEKIVCPSTGLKIFTATAYDNNNITTVKKDTVLVEPRIIEPPSLEFSVNADSVEFGYPVQIEWYTDGNQVVIDQGVGVRGSMGSEELFFANPGNKVFTAIASGQENTTTIRQDSVFVKEAPIPILPVLILSTTSTVTVDSLAAITWHSQNADYIVVDYVGDADLSGNIELSFSTPGTRIVTATAFNQAGYVSAQDTIEVVIPEIVSVDDIILSANSNLRADKGESGYTDMNAATFKVERAGKYQIIAEVWYNSGDSQMNESYYLEIRNEAGNTYFPHNSNAGIHKIIADEPGEPHTASKQSGIFKLSVGAYFIDAFHYVKIAHIYPQYLNGPIDGAESVKILGFKIVYLDD